MTLDLDALEAVAKAGTQGKWETTDGDNVYAMNEARDCNRFTAHVKAGFVDPYEEVVTPRAEIYANAAHIATFSPATCQALIARLRIAEEALKPFAKEANFYDDTFLPEDSGEETPPPISDSYIPMIQGPDDDYEAAYTAGDLRRARQALATTQKDPAP
jgi:hypothetical protein